MFSYSGSIPGVNIIALPLCSPHFESRPRLRLCCRAGKHYSVSADSEFILLKSALVPNDRAAISNLVLSLKMDLSGEFGDERHTQSLPAQETASCKSAEHNRCLKCKGEGSEAEGCFSYRLIYLFIYLFTSSFFFSFFFVS